MGDPNSQASAGSSTVAVVILVIFLILFAVALVAILRSSSLREKLQTYAAKVPFPPLIVAILVFGVAVLAASFYPPQIRERGDPHKWIEPLLSEMSSNLTF